MSSSDNQLFADGGNGADDNTPTHHQPWPYVDPFSQGHFERAFIADGDTINFNTVPKAQPWFSDGHRVVSVLTRVASHAHSAKRPLTGLEANAVGEHAVHAVRYIAWIQPLSVSLAFAVSLAGRRTFKFPIYQPKMKLFDPNSFPTQRWPLLKGRLATATWHLIRFVCYLPVMWFPTAVLLGSIAETSFSAHTTRDPRLASLTEEIRQNAQHSKIERQMRYRARAGNPPQTSPGSYQDNPTPQNDGYSSGTTTEAPQPTQPIWPRSTPTQPSSRRMQENTQPSESRHDDNTFDPFDDDGDDDDASPVAASARRPKIGQGSSSSAGSSWDRIREQAKSGASNWERGDSSGQEKGWAQLRQDKTRTPKDSTPKTDSYSYSSDDEAREKRNYEREQAQKDFDALVEAERRGDGSSSSNNRSWRKG
ncbi:hypothetical protein O1611_g4557 [Lasiodiplodia mahajangana]|uniref:Uncharacterized protein n=1 Tax=Lasiodiplodia mahajangana TaxID=1108764 RepID=A0ACC2JNK2_9PEZI|nr:hypothetical protein O1611_g4557 [Lasiodiplodia mahajangana]